MATSTNDKNNNGTNPPPQNPTPGGYSGGASYPYAFPPPPPPSSYPTTVVYQQPATNFTHQHPSTAAKPFHCGFLSVITAFVAIFGIITLISYLILKPRVPEFRVNSASLTSFNFTNSALTAKWDITFIVSNPNKKLEITYDDISAGIFYGYDENESGVLYFLALTRVAPFNQPKQSKTMIGIEFEILNEFVENSVANGIAEGKDRGFVQFGVVLNVLMKLNSFFEPNDYVLTVTCKPLKFEMLNNVSNGSWVLLSGVNCNM